MKRLNNIIFFLFLCIRTMGQISIDSCTCTYFNEFTNSYSYIKSYRITNNSKEDYVTWVSSMFTNSISNEEAIHRYFRNQIGDYNILFLLQEKLLNSSLTNRIGTSFMKRIKPKETFEYLIIKRNSCSDYFEKRLFLIPRQEIEKYLQTEIPEECFSIINILPLYENEVTEK